MFGVKNALGFVELSRAGEHLSDLLHYPMLPADWVQLNAETRKRISQDGMRSVAAFRERVASLKTAVGRPDSDVWFAQTDLFGVFFECQLRRLDTLCQMQDIVSANATCLESGSGLPAESRTQLLAFQKETLSLSDAYRSAMARIPGRLPKYILDGGLTQPFNENQIGWDGNLAQVMAIAPMAGLLEASVSDVSAGQPFTLKLELRNEGIWPWTSDAQFRIRLSGEAARLGLPETWEYVGDPMVFGDRRTVEIQGTAPREPGTAQIEFEFSSPRHGRLGSVGGKCAITWK